MTAQHNTRRLWVSQEDLRTLMRSISVHDVGVEIMSPKGEHIVLKIDDLDPRAAVILKQEALAVGADTAIGWNAFNMSGEDVDAVLMATAHQIEKIIDKLRSQPFGLDSLAEEIKSIITPHMPSRLRACDRLLTLERPLIMGVLNVTPDSFYDGGRYLQPEAAARRCRVLLDEGADIIDIGGESTRPGSKPVSEEVELQRIKMAVREALDLGAVVSIDTRKPGVADWALNEGAHMINDVSGLASDRMRCIIADHGAACVIMHMKGTPETMQENPTYRDVVGEIFFFLGTRLRMAEESGIQRDSILLDPGIGFGKTHQHNLILLRHLRTFTCLGQPVLVGVSRKSFISSILDLTPEERLEGTLAANVVAILHGANVIRVHDVQAAKRAVAVASAIRDAPLLPYHKSDHSDDFGLRNQDRKDMKITGLRQ